MQLIYANKTLKKSQATSKGSGPLHNLGVMQQVDEWNAIGIETGGFGLAGNGAMSF